MNDKQNTPLDEIDSLFTIDGGEILTKLHLGGVQAVSTKNIFNTGIKNHDSNATPDNIGDVEFNLSNKDGKYEVGIFQNLKLKILKTENDDERILDLKNDKKRYAVEDPKVKKIDEDINKRIKEIYNENKKNAEEVKKDFEKLKKDAIENLIKYFETFAGKEKTNKIDEKTVTTIFLSPKVKSIKDEQYAINEFKFVKISESEVKKLSKQFSKHKTDSNFIIEVPICFKVGYNINKEESK